MKKQYLVDWQDLQYRNMDKRYVTAIDVIFFKHEDTYNAKSKLELIKIQILNSATDKDLEIKHILVRQVSIL